MKLYTTVRRQVHKNFIQAEAELSAVRNMRNTTAFVLFLVSLFITSQPVPFFVGQTSAYVNGFTHSVLDEDFTATG